jgi:hypothetical protein
MKKIISFIVAVLVTIPVTANAGMADILMQELLEANIQTFPDVSAEHHNYLAVEWLFNEGNIEGYPDGTFKPDGAVNRAELMKMTVLMMVNEFDESNGYCFPDVLDEWFAKYVCYANEMGWVDGYPDGLFKPGDSVNRVEAMKIILNAMISAEQWPDPTDADLAVPMPVDLDMDAWYGGYARFALVKELIDRWHMTQNQDGTLNYYPDGDFTRKEVAEMQFRAMVYMVERESYVMNMVESICYYIENEGTMTEGELEAGAVGIFEMSGYSEQEMNELTIKFEFDNIVQDKIIQNASEQCGAEAAG